MASVLLVGGARSGKSNLAQELAVSTSLPVTIVVTGQANDDEMGERIARHKDDRPSGWATVEAPIELVAAVSKEASDRCLIVDCVTIWLSNLLLAEVSVSEIENQARELATQLGARCAPTLIVSNEVGQGIVPMHSLSRQFRDLQGRANQFLTSAVDRTFLVAAGGVTEMVKPSETNFGQGFGILT